MSFATRNVAETQGTTLPGSPKVGAQHFDSNTGITYRCRVADAWEAVAMPPAFGQLYEDGEGTAINITTGGTFVKWVSSTAGLSNLTTLSTGDDTITIDSGGAGTYLITFEASYVGSAAEVFHWAVFVQGSKQDMVSSEIKVGSAAMASQSGTGLVVLSVGDVLDLRVTSTTGTKTVTVNHAQLTLLRVGI